MFYYCVSIPEYYKLNPFYCHFLKTINEFIFHINKKYSLFLSKVMEVCDFEDKSQCGWYQPTLEQTSGSYSIHTTNIFKWELGRATDLYPGQEEHRPLIDHTT